MPADGKVEKKLEDFIDHVRMDSTEEDILYELLLKSGFTLTIPVSEQKIAGKKVYSVAGGSLLICLNAGFSGNDQLRTNALEIMKSHGVDDFRTV